MDHTVPRTGRSANFAHSAEQAIGAIRVVTGGVAHPPLARDEPADW